MRYVKIEMRKETRARKMPKAFVGDEGCLKALGCWEIKLRTARG